MTRLFLSSALLCAAVFAAACGDGSTGPDPKTGTEPPAQAAVESVTLDIAAGTLALGQEVALTPTVRGSDGSALQGRTISWSSSDPAVVAVDGGKVIAIAPGTATVTATVEGKSATSELDVIALAAVSAGPTVTCALSTAGKLHCAGAEYGSLAKPVAHDLTFVALTTHGGMGPGPSHACALTAEGEAFCWGSNQSGQLGTGGVDSVAAPTPVAGGLRFRSIETGAYHTCGVTAEGTAYCWGAGSEGQLGHGRLTSSTTPVPVSGGLAFAGLAVGKDHTCGVTAEGQAHCWGFNDLGQLGSREVGVGGNSDIPVPVAGGESFRSLASGWTHTCGLTEAGVTHCWGDNTLRELGATPSETCDGEKPCSSVPVRAAGSFTFASLAVSVYTTCGITGDQKVYCWGADWGGKMGATERVPTCPVRGAPFGCTPKPVAGPANIASLSGGQQHSCGVAVDGRALCWGANDFGQLGNPAPGLRADAPVVFGLDPAATP